VLPNFVFSAGGKAGALGGRAGANALCTAAAPNFSFPKTNVVALISVSAGDQIRDFPALYGVPSDRPIVGPTGLRIADNWADLLDGTTALSMAGAGVLDPGGAFWLTGSNFDGTVSVHTCTNWTSPNGFLDGEYGYDMYNDTRFIDTGASTCGLVSYNVVCLGYSP
jgi:hypothetical protein